MGEVRAIDTRHSESGMNTTEKTVRNFSSRSTVARARPWLSSWSSASHGRYPSLHRLRGKVIQSSGEETELPIRSVCNREAHAAILPDGPMCAGRQSLRFSCRVEQLRPGLSMICGSSPRILFSETSDEICKLSTMYLSNV